MSEAMRYVEDVLSGRRRECRWVRLACERHVNDLRTGRERGLWFDERAARTVIAFFGLLRHSKGEWAGQPVALEPWQQFHLWDLFGWKREDGTRRFRVSYLEVGRKNGKALAIDTPVATVDGWKKHGDLLPGDRVFGPDGKPRMVTAVTGWYDGPSWELEFSDGTSIVAHDQHEWATERRAHTKRPRGSRQPLPLVTTEEIAGSLRSAARQDLVHRIGVSGALAYPKKELLIDPYVLGVWLGDGHSDCARVTTADIEIMDEVSRRGYLAEKSRHKYLYLVGRGRLHVELRDLGVLGHKHIPALYLRGSIEQRMDLLRGLMDTDGYVSKAGQCELVLTNRRLFDDAVELIRSLGFKASVKVDRAMLRGVDCGERYRAQFWSYSDWPAALLARKAARLKERPGRRTRNGTLMIVSARPVGDVTVNCIEVEGGFYLAGRGLVKTHNSTMGAGVGLYLQAADGEPGAEIYTAATKRDQARIVHQEAVRMVKQSPALGRELRVYKDNIHSEKTFSKFEPLGRDSGTLDGLNVHGAIVDEVHAHPSGDMWDVLQTATGARRQPLLYAVTTAGFDRQSLCWQFNDYTQKVVSRVLDDDSWHGLIYTLDVDDDWEDEANWYKANPNLGVSKKLDDLRDKARAAKGMPARLNGFLQKELNVWTQASTRWIDPEAWRRCNQGAVVEESLVGRECWGGLDLSSTLDVTALAWVFPRGEAGGSPAVHDVVCRLWVPEENVAERVKRDRAPYDVWIREGWMRTTPGNVVDYEYIMAQVSEDLRRFRVREIAFDPWNATAVSNRLMDEGAPMVEFRQGFVSMNPAMKTLEVAVQTARLNHGGNPALAWMADNLVATSDPAGNLKPDKGKSTEKIDGMVALLMALHRAALAGGTGESVYATRGIRTL